jgi:CBS domain-containing protein
MSPRAASRLEALSFREVHDYAAGKADWLAAGLPAEGSEAGIPHAGDLARRDVPTCGLNETVAQARERAREAGWSECIVVNEENVVLGRLSKRALDGDAEATVETAMDPGPSTIRPSVALDEIVTRLRERDLERALVTTADGHLDGVLRLDDAERRLEEIGKAKP